jgi:hypothetical protein
MIHSQNETDPIINEEVTSEDIVPVTKNSWLNPTNDLGKLESGFVMDSITYGSVSKPNLKELQVVKIKKTASIK